MTNFDAVPWFTEGGRHSANVARNVAYAAFKGKQGIMAPKDFEVRETATPGASVDVYPGTVSIINRAGGVHGEMYVGRLPILDNVAIAATTAAPRHDLICARVVNPFFEGGFPSSGWPTLDTDPKLGPFIALFVVSNVGATIKTLFEHDPTMTGIALARIDLPASTSVVDQSMIVDLRKMSGVRNERFFKIVAPAATGDLMTSATYTNWPDEANMSVDVPEWATHVNVRAIFAGILAQTADSAGLIRCKVGTDVNATYSETVAYNVSSGDRTTFMVGGVAVPVPAAYRGTTITVSTDGQRTSGTGSINADTKSMLSIEVEFIEKPESNV